MPLPIHDPYMETYGLSAKQVGRFEPSLHSPQNSGKAGTSDSAKACIESALRNEHYFSNFAPFMGLVATAASMKPIVTRAAIARTTNALK